jgi:copper resistance protein B
MRKELQMHIIIKSKFCYAILLSWMASSLSYAEPMPMSVDSSQQALHMAQQSTDQALWSTPAVDPASHAMHAATLYQAASLESKAMWDKGGQAEAQSELKWWIGSDKHKLFVKAKQSKAESESSHTDLAIYYRRYLAEYWDLQWGLRHEHDRQQHQDDTAAVIGLNGMAPYFFETELEWQWSDQQSLIRIESSRDLLLSQQWIIEPYVEASVMLYDQHSLARKTGLSELELGLQSRYEISKKLMPFFELGYRYDRGYERQDTQDGLRYGLGITFKF